MFRFCYQVCSADYFVAKQNCNQLSEAVYVYTVRPCVVFVCSLTLTQRQIVNSYFVDLDIVRISSIWFVMFFVYYNLNINVVW